MFMIILPAHCSTHLHWNAIFIFWYKFLLYIMEQISCLCSVRSWQYTHILHNKQHVTSYWYKLSCEFKKPINAKMLAVMAPIYSECTYKVCVCFMWLLVARFREMCAEWRVFGASPCCVSCWTATTTLWYK